MSISLIFYEIYDYGIKFKSRQITRMKCQNKLSKQMLKQKQLLNQSSKGIAQLLGHFFKNGSCTMYEFMGPDLKMFFP